MDKRNSQRSGKLLAAAVASVGLAGFAASQANASLVVDLRAVSATGTGNTIAVGGKTVTLGAIDGRTVTIGVYARIGGTNATQTITNLDPGGSDEMMTINDDSLQSLVGAFTSGNGALKGNMGSAVAGPNSIYAPQTAPFNGSGLTNGAFSDFDSDGDLDLGAIGTDPTNMWAARAGNPSLGAITDAQPKGFSSSPFNGFTANSQDSLTNASTSEVRIGTIRFIASAGAGAVSTDLQFIVRQNGDAAGLWFEDGITTGKNPTNSPFSVGIPVTVQTVPEPASIGLLGLASLGLLARRRKA